MLKQTPDGYKDYSDRTKLPNDVESLKDIIVEQHRVFCDYRNRTEALIHRLMEKIERLEQEVSLLRRSRYGQKYEKSQKGQKPSGSASPSVASQGT
jgi:hypothetical protein